MEVIIAFNLWFSSCLWCFLLRNSLAGLFWCSLSIMDCLLDIVYVCFLFHNRSCASTLKSASEKQLNWVGSVLRARFYEEGGHKQAKTITNKKMNLFVTIYLFIGSCSCVLNMFFCPMTLKGNYQLSVYQAARERAEVFYAEETRTSIYLMTCLNYY